MAKKEEQQELDFFETLMLRIQEFFEGFMSLFSTDEAEAASAEEAVASPKPAPEAKAEPQATEAPAQEVQAEPATPSPTLTYDKENNDTSWLNPKDYEGKISIPDSVIEEARAKGEKGAYGIVAVDAAYRIGENGEKQPYARGFHVFVDFENGNKTTLVPMMSGGESPIDEINFANNDGVESSNNAPMPGLLHDSEQALKGVNRRGVLETGDADDTRLGFFMLMSDGKENRDFIGSHPDLIETEKGEVADQTPWGSRGCPMIPKEYEQQYRELLKTHGIGQGDNFYVLDNNAVSTIGADLQLAGVNQSSPDASNHLPNEAHKPMQRSA